MSRRTIEARFGFLGSARTSVTALTGDQVISEYANIVDGALWRLPQSARRSAVTDMDDLRQEGLLALVTAARSFDPERGIPFPAYARRCVENALVSTLRRCDTFPESVRRDAQALRAVEDEYRRSAEPLSVFELSFHSGLSEERVREVQDWLRREQPVALDDVERVCVDASSSTPEEACLAAEEARAVADALRRLPERSRRILLARVVHGTPVRTVARDEGLSAARVSQIYGLAAQELMTLINV